jgi:hypothetical protein
VDALVATLAAELGPRVRVCGAGEGHAECGMALEAPGELWEELSEGAWRF